MNFILFFVIISVLLLDKFYFKKNNSDNIDKILLTAVDSKNHSKFKLKNRSIFIISALVVVIVLKLIFHQNLQDLSTSFFSINIDELLICIFVLIFYIYFSIITVSSRVSNKKIIAREFLYLVFNLILISGLWFSQSKLEEDFQNYSTENSEFLKEIKDQAIIKSTRVPVYDLNEFQSKKAKDLGYVIDNEKYLISKWYEVLKKSSNTTPYKKVYWDNDQDIKRIGYRDAHTFNHFLMESSVDPSSRYGINYIPSSHIDSLKFSNPKLYNDFIDFFGPLNKLDLDEFYGALNKFYYKDKPAKISVSKYSSNDLTLDYTIGKYSINDISNENISKRRIKKYYHSYYRKSPTDTRKIIPKKNTKMYGSTVGNPFSRGGNLYRIYDGRSSYKNLLTTQVSQYPKRKRRGYAGVYVWRKAFKNSDDEIQPYVGIWESYYNFEIKVNNAVRDGYKGYFNENGIVGIDLTYGKICDYYNCETYSVTTDYNISMDYTETDKEKILNFPIVENLKYLDQYNDLFSQIDGYDYNDFYNIIDVKTLAVRDFRIYNKTNNIYSFSLFKSLNNLSLELYEKYIILFKDPLVNMEIQYVPLREQTEDQLLLLLSNSNNFKLFVSDIQREANSKRITFDEYKNQRSLIFTKGDVNNKASFIGLIFIIAFIAYLCRLLISGIIWSISALK